MPKTASVNQFSVTTTDALHVSWHHLASLRNYLGLSWHLPHTANLRAANQRILETRDVSPRSSSLRLLQHLPLVRIRGQARLRSSSGDRTTTRADSESRMAWCWPTTLSLEQFSLIARPDRIFVHSLGPPTSRCCTGDFSAAAMSMKGLGIISAPASSCTTFMNGHLPLHNIVASTHKSLSHQPEMETSWSGLRFL